MNKPTARRNSGAARSWSRLVAALLSAAALGACSDGADRALHGYVEGEYALIAPEGSGRIVRLSVEDGDVVAAGAALFELDDAAERARVEQAAAAARAARARQADAAIGGRAPEIEAAREQLDQAEAADIRARDDLERAVALLGRGVIPRSQYDAAEATARASAARVSELRAQLRLIKMPARENQRAALEQDSLGGEAALAAARDALAKRAVAAPSAGRIERVLRRPGETAGPTAPVLRFLPQGAAIAVLFAPEPMLGGLKLGDRLAVDCDGCGDSLTARISVIASQAEYTAPTIFSDTERARLVFRIEARFDGPAPPPGAPIRAEPMP